MNADERTLADLLGAAGYATGCFGRWHNGTQWPLHPRARGFATFEGFTEGHWADYFDAEIEHDDRFVKGSGYLADDLTNHLIGFVERQSAGPFFCYLAFNAPHSPMSVPDVDWQPFRDREIMRRGPQGDAEEWAFTRAALAMVENLDHNVGRLLAALDRADIGRDTIVVFLSDNGPNSSRWCGGMRGRKGSTDDGGVRSVCCIRYPTRITAGTRVAEAAGAIDLLPTICVLAGVPIPAGRSLDGIDLAPLLVAGSEAPGLAARLRGRPLIASWGGKVSVRTTRHRLDAEGRLYDLEADPGQTRDLAAAEPAEAARQRAIAADWRLDVLELGDDRVPRRQEGYSKDFRPLRLGAIDLPAGPGTLVLRATAIPGEQVADVRRLLLVPVRD